MSTLIAKPEQPKSSHKNEKTTSSFKNLCNVRFTVQLAQEVGEKLGTRKIL